MFIITGGLGRIGTLIREDIELLKEANIFDKKMNDAMIVGKAQITEFYPLSNRSIVIHLAEPPQPAMDSDSRRLFMDNQANSLAMLREVGAYGAVLLYADSLNTPSGTFGKLKSLTGRRVQSQLAQGYILPLPELLPNPTKAEVTTTDLFNLLLRFAVEKDGVYLFKRSAEEMVYLATDQMIVETFKDALDNLGKVTPGVLDNVHTIKVKASTFVSLIEKHFPGTNIIFDARPVKSEDEENNIDLLDQYFSSLNFSVLHL